MKFKPSLRLVFSLTAVMVVIQLLNTFTLGAISSFGIAPRTVYGLIGIPLAPFIHHGWGHLLSNLIPMVLLALLVCQLGARQFWQGTAGIIGIGGLLVWLLGSHAYHAGASGLIFGYWGLLLGYAWFHRSIKSLLIAMVVLFLYGGMLLSFLDLRPHVSWSSHVFGAIAGICMAWWLSRLKSDALVTSD